MKMSELLELSHAYKGTLGLMGLSHPIAPVHFAHASQKRVTRKKLWERQKGICAYCDVAFASEKEATIDHIVPKSRGGTVDITNLVLAHHKCNAMKGDLHSYEEGVNRMLTFYAFITVLKQKGYLK